MIRVSRGNKGFTLIELLIVVAIIGILAAIAIPAYSSYTTKSRVAGVTNALGALKDSITAYYTDWSESFPNATNGQANVAAIYGIALPMQYATDAGYTVTWNNGARSITATAILTSVGGGLDNQTITLTGLFTQNPPTWQWTGIPAQYLPKN